MKPHLSKNSLKSTRYHYFKMFIGLGIVGQTLVKENNFTDIRTVLSLSGFIQQKRLEKTLYRFESEYRGRNLYLEEFNGQLESDGNENPHWNISLKTNSMITARSLGKLLSSELFQTKNNIDPRIRVYSSMEFAKIKRERLFSLGDRDLGFFNKKFLKVLDLLQTEEVKELAQAMDNMDKSEKSYEAIKSIQNFETIANLTEKNVVRPGQHS